MNLSVRSVAEGTLATRPPLSLKRDIFGISPGCEPALPLSLKRHLEDLRRTYPGPGQPSWPRALALFKMSRHAYRNEEDGLGDKVSEVQASLRNVARESACDAFELVKAYRESNLIRDTEVFLAKNGHDDLVVAFRGSETDDRGVVRDWVGTDGAAVIRRRYERRPGPGRHPNKIHRGFYTAFLEIASRFEKRLAEMVRGARRPHLFFTGHSLGGALATIAAMDFAVRQQDGSFPAAPITLYSFASPRCLNFNCQQSVFRKVVVDAFAIVNDNDRIPGLPPVLQGTRLRYAHVDPIVILKSDGSSSRVKGDDYRGRLITGPLGGHRVKEYAKRVEAAVSR